MKIVTPLQMKEIENQAYEAGASERVFMKNAGEGVASAIEKESKLDLKQSGVSVLCGKGNNGGDGFVAASYFLKKGINVSVLQPEENAKCSVLCKEMREAFLKLGGKVFSDLKSFAFSGIIIDALFGTGFKGAMQEPYLSVITAANQSDLPIYSIDIPSGLNGESGKVENSAIQASATFFLEFPKKGFFLEEGWNHVGKLVKVSFGLSAFRDNDFKTGLNLVTKQKVASFLPAISRNRHKYQTGCVTAFAGSYNMPGAALIAAKAAFRGGAGMVRLLHPKGIESLLTTAPYELIRIPFTIDDQKTVVDTINKGRALFIGPGLGDGLEIQVFIKNFLSRVKVPTVIDADALRVLTDSSLILPIDVILTPHRGEMQRLLGDFELSPLNTLFLQRCQNYAEEKKVTLIIKGAPTFIFQAGQEIYCSCVGDPGMATAGTGDLLTGLIAALLAQGLEGRKAALLGVYLHGLAGELTRARRETSYGMMATDLLENLGTAFSLIEDQDNDPFHFS